MNRDYESVIEKAKRMDGDRDARMIAITDVFWEALKDTGVSWIGFYVHENVDTLQQTQSEPGASATGPSEVEKNNAGQSDQLILRVCRDKPACSPIGLHGACGQSFLSGEPLVVRDVKDLGEDYIACDPRDRSEVIVPLFDEHGTCWGVLDADSFEIGAFDETDVDWLTKVLAAAGLTACSTACNVTFDSDEADSDTARMKSTPERLYEEGIQHGQAGDSNRAIESYSECLVEDPTYFLAYLNRAVAYLSIDAPEQALSDLDACIEYASKDWEAAYVRFGGSYPTKQSFVDSFEGSVLSHMGQALYKCGRHVEAAAKYVDSYAQYPACTTLVEMGLAFRESGDVKSAAECFRRYLDDPSLDEDKLYPVGDVARLLESLG